MTNRKPMQQPQAQKEKPDGLQTAGPLTDRTDHVRNGGDYTGNCAATHSQKPVAMKFPRDPNEGWTIDPAFLRRVKHSIDPETHGDFTLDMEEIETTLLALEVIPPSLYTAPQPNTKVNLQAIPEQISEPVAVVKTLSMGEGKPPFHYIECRHLPEGTPLYTAPQPALSKEPVGWFFTGQDGSEYCSEKDSREGVWTPLFTKANFEATPKQISEPVAMRFDFDGYGYQYIDSGSGSNWQTRHKDAEPLYTAPQRREWVGLTEEEIYPLYSEPSSDAEMVEFARAIEAKLREKNA